MDRGAGGGGWTGTAPLLRNSVRGLTTEAERKTSVGAEEVGGRTKTEVRNKDVLEGPPRTPRATSADLTSSLPAGTRDRGSTTTLESITHWRT